VNLFVAQFIGSPAMNVFEGVYREGAVQALGASWPCSLKPQEGQRVKYGIRPEHLQSGGAGIAAEVVVVEPMGAETELLVKLQEQTFTVITRGRSRAGPGDRVLLAPQAEHAHLFDAASGRRL
jgi:multiple sugar transport system ATP-binding protein